MAGLYIHIPFCKQACYYCDFHFSTNQNNKTELIKHLVDELAIQKDYLGGETLETIYLGGGTPSLLTPAEIELIFATIKKYYPVSENPEITLEANPDDLNPTTLAYFHKAGVNRLSIGIQSFDDTILKYLNRAHSGAEGLNSISLAHHAGINNISIDLIFAIPNQDNDLLKKNLEIVTRLKPTHVSAYSLTVEEKTVFGRWAKQGKLLAMDESQAAIQFDLVMDFLHDAGYHQYEISNYCLPGYESKHNTSYWQQKKYLGIGPSAHSYDGISRQFNVNNNALYSKALQEGRIPFEREVLTLENKINEYIFTSLRTSLGCDFGYLTRQFEYDLKIQNDRYLNQLLIKNLIAIDKGKIHLTRSGKLLADRIAADLFIVEKTES
ncbi:MAG: radical SAM family heme chaperone HemW [Cytophagales bacterium]|nr:radical SAM family heme chaperone HemW [Cytophagales bacterium]